MSGCVIKTCKSNARKRKNRVAFHFIREGEDLTFDPHEHRKVKKPTSYSDTMTHLLKGSLGAGVLAMPEAFMRLGIIWSTVALVLTTVFATYCIQLLIEVQYSLCRRWKRGYMAYPKSMKFALQDGPPCMRWAAVTLYYIVDITLILWQLGICCIYFVFVAENIKQICDYYGWEQTLRLHVCYLLIPTIAVNLIKDLKLMTPMSSISNVLTLLGVILVFYYLLEDDLKFEDEKMNIKGLIEIPHFVGTALFALEAVGVALALEYNMEDPKHFVGCCGVFNIGMVVIVVLYQIIGMVGYLKYGDDIKASITLNLPRNEKKAQAAKLLFALTIFLSFPLQNFVAYEIIWRRLQKKIPENINCMIDYIVRVVLVVIPWLAAVASPYLGPIISLFGALCLSLLAMIFPGLMDIGLCYKHPNNYGLCKYKLVRDVIIVIFGIFCLISGVFTSVLEIIKN